MIQSHTHDVVVVGAGIAGLSAAVRLMRSGADVVVLEKQDYPGGRVRTVRYGDQYAEAGAMVAGGEEISAISELVRVEKGAFIDLGAHGVNLYFGNGIVKLTRADGEIRNARDLLSLLRFYLKTLSPKNKFLPQARPSLLYHYRRILREIRRQSDKITYPYDPTAQEGWDSDTFAEFIDRGHPDLKPFFELQLRVTAGDLIDEISSFWGIVTVDWNIKTNFFWLAGGASRLPLAMATSLGDRLRLNSDVFAIEQNGAWRVKYRRDGVVEDIYARSVLLAMPPKQVLNATRLPDWKRHALENVRFGAYLPVHLCYRSKFWEGKIKGGYLNCAGTVFADLVDGTYGQSGPGGILMAFIAGSQAKELMDMSDQHVLGIVRQEVEKIFPGAESQFIMGRVFRWPDAIPFFSTGYGEILRAVRKPLGELFFCGDYTQGAGMYDAMYSGQIAAEQVISFLKS